MTKERVFQIFGHITVMYSTLDFLITTILIKLTKKTSAGMIAIDHRASIGKKLIFLKNLKYSDVRSPKVLDEIKIILPEAFFIADERNRFIHDNWIFSTDDLANGGIRRISILPLLEGKLNIETSDLYTEESLVELSSKIGQLQIIFGKLYETLESEIQK